VSESEIKRIARHLNIDTESFLMDYCQWSGGRPLIRSSDSGYCIFWDKVCTIHEVKPRMCSIWPFIESMLVDPANWAMVQSVCPGVIRDINEEDLAECVRQVEAEYERQRHGFELSASVIGPLQRSLKEISS
jgi:Fe-S-cluster containining protein